MLSTEIHIPPFPITMNMVVGPALSALRVLLLFTWSDFKTILIPITAFAQLSRDHDQLMNISRTTIWVWLHLLQFCVSNQSLSIDEDMKNKPWRPLPSNLINLSTAQFLRWAIVPICLFMSYLHGIFHVSAIFAVVIYLNNEQRLDAHWLPRHLFNALGYACFDWGACSIANIDTMQSHAPRLAQVVSMFIIFTTVHAQDFRDEEGDRITMRKTIPIMMPLAGRISMPVLLVSWSLGLSAIWKPSPQLSLILLGLGSVVGSRFVFLSSSKADNRSYLLYNMWLTLARAIPLLAVSA